MDFLFVTTYELDALREIPLNQRVLYLMGLRPYMDRKTFMVGIKRRISYQSLRETLYVAPIKGVKTGCPSHQQMKQAIKSLARQGIIEIQSTTTHLIVKCLLADPNDPLPSENESPSDKNLSTPVELSQPELPADQRFLRGGKAIKKSAPDFKSNSELQVLYKKFEQFWQYYPLPSYKTEAWKQFQNINPDEVLFEQIMNGLQERLAKFNQSTSYWPYPASWLGQRCWLNNP